MEISLSVETKVQFRSLAEPLADTTTTAEGRVAFHMFGAFAEFESDPGAHPSGPFAAARRAGRTGDRLPKLTVGDLEVARALLADPDIGATQIADRLGVSPATLYGYIPAARSANTSTV